MTPEEENNLKQQIEELLKTNIFTKRERQIINERFDLDKENPRSMEEILEVLAKELGISREKIRTMKK